VSDLQCPARVVLARHAETEYESPLLLDQGGSLTAAGRVQARRLGEALRGERVALVVSSTVSRAVQTAEIAAGVLGVGVEVREGLHEFASGEHRGEPAGRQLFDPVLDRWLRGELEARIPGAESGLEVAARVRDVLDGLADLHRGETLLVVGHGGTMLAALVGLAGPVGRVGLSGHVGPGGADPVPRSGDFRIEYCDRFTLEGDGDGWRLVSGREPAAAD
jgi:broad specificity phosphatase PhoE